MLLLQHSRILGLLEDVFGGEYGTAVNTILPGGFAVAPALRAFGDTRRDFPVEFAIPNVDVAHAFEQGAVSQAGLGADDFPKGLAGESEGVGLVFEGVEFPAELLGHTLRVRGAILRVIDLRLLADVDDTHK